MAGLPFWWMKRFGMRTPHGKNQGLPRFHQLKQFQAFLLESFRKTLSLFYLLGGLKPDFRTIADFRKDNAKAIRNTFRAFGKLCMKLGLYKRELLAVDGTKIRAVKWYRGAHYLLCRGKTKAAAELGLSFLAYNMTRAINMVGVQALIAAM